MSAMTCNAAVCVCVQKRWAQKEKEMREQMKKLKSGPSTSEYSSFHGKETPHVTEVVFI